MHLTDMKVVVSPGALQDLKPYSFLTEAEGQHTVVSLKNCTFEAGADSPQLNKLTACFMGCGAQVGVPGCIRQQHPA
jgi:hypothetical protein